MSSHDATNSTPASPSLRSALLHSAVIVSALGYFVDIYDLVLFSIVRKSSLEDLGLHGADILSAGVMLINTQMIGMLIGGIFFGILGDKRGRLSVLFASILLYSVANIANAFVTTIPAYAVLRFLAGLGLAGELGAAVTLVSESLPKQYRGYATGFVAGFGVSGAVVAGFVAQVLAWKMAYVVGGVLGLVLLVLRIRLRESPMFQTQEGEARLRGNFFMLWNRPERAIRYLASIFVGMPTWFVIGILATFSPEITAALGATAPVSAATTVMLTYAGLVFGDLGSGILSQYLQSRKKVIYIFLAMIVVFMIAFLHSSGRSPDYYYAVAFFIGLGAGYWAIFVTTAVEQFGTNLRATVGITAPNFVRGLLVPMTLAFQALNPSIGLKYSALAVGTASIVIAYLAAASLKECFGRDLNFLED